MLCYFRLDDLCDLHGTGTRCYFNEDIMQLILEHQHGLQTDSDISVTLEVMFPISVGNIF